MHKDVDAVDASMLFLLTAVLFFLDAIFCTIVHIFAQFAFFCAHFCMFLPNLTNPNTPDKSNKSMIKVVNNIVNTLSRFFSLNTILVIECTQYKLVVS